MSFANTTLFHVEHTPISPPKSCLLCDNKSFTNQLELKDHFLSGENFAIFSCDSCGLMITQPTPALDKLADYYESPDYISHSNQKQGLFNQVYQIIRKITLKRKLRLIRKYTRGDSVLDIGCATGEFLNYCALRGMNATGIEPNRKAREFAKQQYRLKVEDEQYLSNLRDASFSVITMWHVMEHVPDINERMATIYRLLADDGVAFIALPNPNSYDALYYNEFWAAWDVPRHLYHFTREAFNFMAEKFQFRVVNRIPMRFDSYYVSLLSEKYMKGKTSVISAMFRGLLSNRMARKVNSEYSSVIYVIKKSRVN